MLKKILKPLPLFLHRSRLRVPILKQLLTFDNFLRRWITFFSFEKDTHVRHRLTKYHQFFLAHISNNDSVLDIGCGQGLLTNEIAQKAKQVIGIDNNKESITCAKKNFVLPNLTFINDDVTSYHFQQTFDIIVLSNVLEHIKDRTRFLNKIRNTAKHSLSEFL